MEQDMNPPSPDDQPFHRFRQAPHPWTPQERRRRLLWMLIGQPIFRLSFHNFYGFRRWWLGLFGARLGARVGLRPTVKIEIPWNLEIGDETEIGDYVILYALGPIRIGKRVAISQYAHLCAGTHDPASPTFELLKQPITVGDDVWIAADAFIGPNVTIGPRAVVGARSSVFGDLPAGQICVGSPARPIRPRLAEDGSATPAEPTKQLPTDSPPGTDEGVRPEV